MINFEKMRNQYLDDPTTHQVVKMLVRLMDERELSPYEIRSIAMFAVYQFESRRTWASPVPGKEMHFHEKRK